MQSRRNSFLENTPPPSLYLFPLLCSTVQSEMLKAAVWHWCVKKEWKCVILKFSVIRVFCYAIAK